MKLDFAAWGGDQNILAQFTQNGDNIVGNTLRMAWNLGWNQRYFTDSGDFVQGQQSMPAAVSWYWFAEFVICGVALAFT